MEKGATNQVFLRGKRLVRFEVLQNVLVPRSREFSEGEKVSARALVNLVLMDKGPAIHRRIGLFLWLIDFIAVIMCGHTVGKLNSHQQKRVMDFFYDSPIALFRKGFWGVNTLCKLGVYGQAKIQDEIGYVKRPVKS